MPARDESGAKELVIFQPLFHLLLENLVRFGLLRRVLEQSNEEHVEMMLEKLSVLEKLFGIFAKLALFLFFVLKVTASFSQMGEEIAGNPRRATDISGDMSCVLLHPR